MISRISISTDVASSAAARQLWPAWLWSPGVLLHAVGHAKPADKAVSGDVRWGMLIDSNKCAEGCNDCVQACNDEHGLTGFGRPATDAQWIRKVTLKDKQTGYTQTLPLLCQHCEKPPCVDVCPTGASFRRADGIVLVDKHICIGCRYCMMACPYKARSFIHETLHGPEALYPARQGYGRVLHLLRTPRGQRRDAGLCRGLHGGEPQRDDIRRHE